MVDIFEKAYDENSEKSVDKDENMAQLGDDVNLTAKDQTLKKILIGSGWDVNAFDADALDLDLSLILVDRENMTRDDQEFVFYNNVEAYDGAVKHNGDSRTGAGDGDDESITVNLQEVPFEIMKILCVISVYKGDEKEQSIQMVRNAYIRIVNAENGHELVRFELDDVFEGRTETAIVAGYVNREGPKWHFVPADEFVDGGLGGVASRHGLIIGQQ